MPKTKIITNFDMKALLAERTRSKNKTTDLVAALTAIDENFPELKETQALKIPVSKEFLENKELENPARSFLMNIRGKLTHVTKKGAPWAGRSFKAALDPTNENVYVLRGKDVKPKEYKTGRAASASKASGEAVSKASGEAVVTTA